MTSDREDQSELSEEGMLEKLHGCGSFFWFYFKATDGKVFEGRVGESGHWRRAGGLANLQ